MSKDKTNRDRAFASAIEYLTIAHDIDTRTAIAQVQEGYSDFKNRNQKLTERQLDQSNRAQIQLISHFALLATLTLTVTGFLITQSSDSLTDAHKWLILIILVSEIASIFFGYLDYKQTIDFHDKWARMYRDIDTEVEAKFKTGELQMLSDLGEIEQQHLNKMDETTNEKISKAMVILCLFGLIVLVALFGVYFFDVPFWNY
ncbi:TPA: hypothetical protein DD425_03705 [Candidatus Saccharibacteria bacterium]|nr:hypothetical protein [Candidatus Saccharibacteria bacterium]|tara:strand:+ start:1009 stop:1614 length:606 start_codon:yes stop_codon:yes gene_type:complete